MILLYNISYIRFYNILNIKDLQDMVLSVKNIGVIQKLPYSENDINKAFGIKKAKEFKEFSNRNLESFEIETDKLIKFANILNIPFAYIFLNELPKTEKEIADFRAEKKEFSNNLQTCIASSKKKQEWFRSYLIRNGYDKFLNNKNFNTDETIIEEIKNLISYDKVVNKSKGKRFNYIKDILEEKNIIVQQSGVSQNENRKSISLEECRGYAIYDEYAPLIFINSKDTSENGKIFTLLHELSHILLKHSGISSYNFKIEEEYKCNNIASEILMPLEEFKKQWDKNISVKENVEKIYSYFSGIASNFAIITKAMLNNFIEYEEYERLKYVYLSIITKVRKNAGGNYYTNIIASNSKNFAIGVITDTLNGYETYKDAINLLDIKSVKAFNRTVKELGIK